MLVCSNSLRFGVLKMLVFLLINNKLGFKFLLYFIALHFSWCIKAVDWVIGRVSGLQKSAAAVPCCTPLGLHGLTWIYSEK